MSQIKILRAKIDNDYVYCADEHGIANVPDYWFKAYIEALRVISIFEKMVNEQYEKS